MMVLRLCELLCATCAADDDDATSSSFLLSSSSSFAACESFMFASSSSLVTASLPSFAKSSVSGLFPFIFICMFNESSLLGLLLSSAPFWPSSPLSSPNVSP